MAAASPARGSCAPIQDAERLARRGLPVLPLLGKVPPKDTAGFYDATTDAATVREWATRYPGCNYGIRTGQPLRNGGFLAVLDLDPRHGGGASLSRWVAENGSLPDTYTVATGGGGEHRYFDTPEPLSCRTGVLPGVDLKADGGYVVGPGSVHPGDPKRNVPPGGRYEVRRNVPVAPMPAALLALVAKPAARTAGAAEPAPAAPIADGHRNATLTSLAGSMRRRGMRAVAIRAALLAENAARCTPPLSEVEVTSIAKSVATYPPEAVEPPRPLVREIPPADPYPVEALGSVLSGAARAIHDRIQAPDAVCGQSVLASATLAAQAHADVVLPTGARRPLSLFLLSVLETGGRKTACDNVAGEPLRRWEAAEPEKHGPEYLRRRNEDDVWEQERRKVLADTKENPAGKREKLKTLGPEPIAPPLPMLTCPEPTFEGLCKMLAVSHPSVGVYAGEGGQFVGGHGMNTDNKLRTATGFSGIWDGDPIRRVRVGDGASVLPGRRVSMHLMMQPGVAAELLADAGLADQGLLSRMLLTAPESTAGTRFWREPLPAGAEALAHYNRRILELLNAPLPLVEGTPNELNPRPLPLSSSARRAWTAYADHIERQLAPEGPLDAIRGLANKLPEHAARIAGALALVENLDSSEIAAEHLESGIELADHLEAA